VADRNLVKVLRAYPGRIESRLRSILREVACEAYDQGFADCCGIDGRDFMQRINELEEKLNDRSSD